MQLININIVSLVSYQGCNTVIS